MGENRHLPESELDIMLVVWGAGGPVSAPAILEGLERPLTASALHSYLKRLEEKGFLSCKKTGKVNTLSIQQWWPGRTINAARERAF